MEDIFEEIHNEFINSEEYLNYLKEIEIWSEKNNKDTCQLKKIIYLCNRN
jgi:hypothetical protein